MRIPFSSTVESFENVGGASGKTFVSSFSVFVIGEPIPTMVRYWSTADGSLAIEVYDVQAKSWLPHNPDFDPDTVRAQFGDTVLHGALRQDVLMRLELRQEDNIVSGQSFLSHNQWSLFSEEEDKFWSYHAISIPGRNAPILFRHTDRPGTIEPEVQIFDYRTAGWQAFPMVRQYYATEAFQNSAAAAGFLHELMPHLSSAICR